MAVIELLNFAAYNYAGDFVKNDNSKKGEAKKDKVKEVFLLHLPPIQSDVRFMYLMLVRCTLRTTGTRQY